MRLLVAASLLALALADPQIANTNVNSFDSVDSNLDGAIDFNEFEKWQKSKILERNDATIRNVFARFDANHDGKLDVPEFVPLAYEVSQKPTNTAEQIFRNMDTNGDAVVDQTEAAVARQQFGAEIVDGILYVADVNHDGQLTFDEFLAQLNYNRPKSKEEEQREMAAQLVAIIDRDGDQKLNAVEIFEFAKQYNTVSLPDIQKIVARLDANHDGALSMPELTRLSEEVSRMLAVRAPPTV